MITRLILKNFMAHKHSEIELDPGLTVLTGPNNTGKSAVVEALRCLAANPVPRQFIRHGARQAEVTAVLQDGTRVTWIRKEKTAHYEILGPDDEEPTEFYKFGRRPPEEISRLLRLDQVFLEEHNRYVDVHLGNQRQPIFLLDLPGSAMASFFAASSESSHLLAMQKLLKKKAADAKRQAQDARNGMARVSDLLDRLALLPAGELDLEHGSRMLETIRIQAQNIPLLEQRITRLRTLREQQRRLRTRLEGLDTLLAPPQAHATGFLAALAARGRGLARALHRGHDRNEVLDTLQPLPLVADTRSLSLLISGLRDLSRAQRKAEGKGQVLGSLLSPPAPNDCGRLAFMLAAQRRAHGRHAATANRIECLGHLAPPPEPSRADTLIRSTGRLHGAHAAMRTARDRIQTLEQDIASSRKRIESRLEEAGVCPVCRQPFTVESFLDKDHQHDEPVKGGAHDA